MTVEQVKIASGAAQRFLDTFCLAVDERYRVNWHHELIARKLEEALEKAVRNEKSRIILCLPPRHGKSRLASELFPAWALGKYPQIPVIVAAYNAELAVEFGRNARDLMETENYQAIFSTRLRHDQKAKSRWLTDKSGGLLAVGKGGGITGKGGKILIIDDPFKDREEAESELEREKVWTWYKSAFYTRQEGYGAIVVVNTRWHLDDLVGRLLEKQAADKAAGEEEFDEWDVIELPAIAETDEEHRKAGEALWPEKISLAMLKNTRNTVGIYEWSALYQQQPISSEIQEFRPEWIKRYDESLLETIPGLKYYTLLDLGHSETKKKTNDNTVVRTIAKAPNLPNFYLCDEDAGQFDPGTTINLVFKHVRKYRSEVWIEGVGYQRSLKWHVEDEQKRQQFYFVVNILKRNNDTSKDERIRGLIPFYKTGVMFHRKTGEDAAAERELLAFPQGKHDDRIDDIANVLEAVQTTTTTRTKKAKPDHRPTSEYEG